MARRLSDGVAAAECGVPVLLLTIVALVACPLPVLAHQIHVSAHAHGKAIHGEARFHDETPVRGATITAFDPRGEKIGQTTTDEQGKFSLEAEFRCDHRVLVDTGDGHGAECTVSAAGLPKDLPPRGDSPPPGSAGDERLGAICHEIIHLQEQLARHERRVWLRDVLGGIGYIVGIAGVAFYFLGTRRKQA